MSRTFGLAGGGGTQIGIAGLAAWHVAAKVAEDPGLALAAAVTDAAGLALVLIPGCKNRPAAGGRQPM